MTLATVLFLLPGLVLGIAVHEFAHAWSASLLGDQFPRRQGRVSLNPFRHLSPLGTFALFVLPFGWGRPVMVNLYNFKHPRRDYLLSSLAGPLANTAVVALCLALMQLTRHTFRYGRAAELPVSLAHGVLLSIAILNTVLATVNLIPIPPLDGSKIWPCLIPGLRPTFGRKTMRIFVILLIVLASTRSLSPIINVTLTAVQGLLPVADAWVFDDWKAAALDAHDAKQYARAEALYTAALAINPRDDECFYGRACVRGFQENWGGALEDLNRAVDLNPADAAYYEFRAIVLDALGRHDEAKADRERAAALSAPHGRGP